LDFCCRGVCFFTFFVFVLCVFTLWFADLGCGLVFFACFFGGEGSGFVSLFCLLFMCVFACFVWGVRLYVFLVFGFGSVGLGFVVWDWFVLAFAIRALVFVVGVVWFGLFWSLLFGC
jgi:hypothetical protein